MPSTRKQLVDDVHNLITSKMLEDGSLVEGFVGFYNYTNDKGVRCWDILEPDHQHNDVSLSMSEHLASFFRHRRDLTIEQVLCDFMAQLSPWGEEGDE